MVRWLYKWLPIIFGCHCRDDRSFHWKGKRFPICARCTGELIGMLLAAVVSFWWLPSVGVSFLIMIPLILDGTIQLKTRYESTNLRRVITGFFFGYGLIALLVISSIATFQLGYNLL